MRRGIIGGGCAYAVGGRTNVTMEEVIGSYSKMLASGNPASEKKAPCPCPCMMERQKVLLPVYALQMAVVTV